MSNKSIIDIEINDANFKAFLEAFGEFRAETGDIPKDWDKVADSIGGASSKLDGFTEKQQAAAAGADRGFTRLNRSTRQASQEQQGFAKSARKSSSGLKGIAMDAAEAALGLDVLTGPVGLVTAALGAAAIVAAKATEALDKLTASKAKNAKELGTSIAGARAFTNYGGQLFSNPDATLAEMRSAKMNPADATGLYALGITPATVAHDSTTQLAFLEAKKAHEKLRGVPASIRGTVWEGLTGGQLGGLSQAELFANTRMASINRYQGEFEKHQHAYAITQGAARRAVGVAQGINEAKSKVKTYVMNAAASKTWTDVAQGAIHATRAMLNGGATLAHDAESGGAAFVSSAKQAGHIIVSDAQRAGVALLGKQMGNTGHLAVLKGNMDRDKGTSREPAARASYEQFKASQGAAAKALRPYASDIESAAKASGVKRSVIAGEIWAESGGNANAVSAGRFRGKDGKWHHAHGIGQFRRSTWNEFAGGLPYSDANNPKDAIMTMGKFIAANKEHHKTSAGLESAYSGDQRGSAALTQYQAANQIGAAGWGALLSSLQEIARNTAKPAQVHVHANGTNPGSRTALSAHAAAHG
jgi:putative sterol carrier protein